MPAERHDFPADVQAWKRLLDLARYRYCSHIAMSPEAWDRARAETAPPPDGPLPILWGLPVALGTPIVVDSTVPDDVVELRWPERPTFVPGSGTEVVFTDLAGNEVSRVTIADPTVELRPGESMTITWDTKGNATLELPDSHETLPPAAEPE